MGTKQMGQMDLGTGELLDGLVVYVAKKRTNGFMERWLAMAQEAALIFAKSRKDLGEEGFAVLFMLMAKLDFENHLLINQAEIGRELGMHRQNVQKSIKQLMAMGALMEGPKVGQNRSYKLNPEFGWKGSAKNHHKALSDQRKARMKAAKIMGLVKTPPAESDQEK